MSDIIHGEKGVGFFKRDQLMYMMKGVREGILQQQINNSEK